MRTEWVVYLDDISKTHSITQTAQRFFLSQQALSFALKKMEEEFNTIFLIRTNHGVTLTAEGDVFLKKARSIIDIYYDIKDELEFSNLQLTEDNIIPSGKIKLLTHTRLLEPLLLDVIEKYSRRYPDIQLILQEQENLDILQSIEKEEADLGLIFVPEPFFKEMLETYSKQLKMQQLFSDDFIVCCNRNHAFAQNKNINFENISKVPTLVFDTNAEFLASGIETNIGQSCSNIFFSNNGSFHKEILRRGMAVSVITAFEFRKLYVKYKDLTAIPIENSFKSIIVLISSNRTPLNDAAKLFEKALVSYDFFTN